MRPEKIPAAGSHPPPALTVVAAGIYDRVCETVDGHVRDQTVIQNLESIGKSGLGNSRNRDFRNHMDAGEIGPCSFALGQTFANFKPVDPYVAAHALQKTKADL